MNFAHTKLSRLDEHRVTWDGYLGWLPGMAQVCMLQRHPIMHILKALTKLKILQVIMRLSY